MIVTMCCDVHAHTLLLYIDEVPTLRELLCFPIMHGRKVNLVEKIGPDYFMFGILLLEDDDGGQIVAFEKEQMKNAVDICRQIFMWWLKGKGKQPVTWSTLVTVLQEMDLNQLAKNISDVKLS